MGEDPNQPTRSVSYGDAHMEVVRQGAEAIETFLLEADDAQRASLLFCLDRYLDPYFGYDLPYADKIFEILEREVFRARSIEVKQDALQLMTMYSGQKLELLAKRIGELEPELLGDGLEALGHTYNLQYAAIVKRYVEHDDPLVRAAAEQALIHLTSGQRENL